MVQVANAALAKLKGFDAGMEIMIVPAEQGDIGQVLLGFLFGEEGEGVCQLEEVELIDEEVPTDSDSPHTR